MKRITWILFTIATLTASCVTQFVPEIDGEEYAIVIEGVVTDRNEAHEVRISWSQPLNPTGPQPSTSNYNVSVADDAGNEFPFIHAGGGNCTSLTHCSFNRYQEESTASGRR